MGVHGFHPGVRARNAKRAGDRDAVAENPAEIMVNLELRALRKTFGGTVALERVDLPVDAGEFLTLLGPSGCGKTTVLRIVAGFERPDSGTVILANHDITDVPASRRNMGMVFQAYSLFPNMTAEQNVAFGLRLRKTPRAEQVKRIGHLFELIGLADFRTRYPHQLSGGQQQRVALARALAIEPGVLLLDEPLSALDARVRVQLREEIRRIQTQLKITTLYVTHDQEEALSISDRIAVMSTGRIEQIGTPHEIYGAPATPFVAEFVGTMNRLTGEVANGEDSTVDCGGVMLAVSAARGQPRGQRVLVLVRPEFLEVAALPNGQAPRGALTGPVISQTFLGAITRIKIATESGQNLAADVPSGRAAAFPIGARVVCRFPADSPRVLRLDGR
jgi:putative spermidine/putrescine transport system ATP-binding protein